MKNKTKYLVLTAMFTCMTVILAQLVIDLPSLVPITLLTLGMYLSALFLEEKYAFTSMCLYILMGAIGIGVFAHFNGGAAYLLSPTGGYIYSLPVCAFVISYISHKKEDTLYMAIALIAGTLINYCIGTLHFSLVLHKSFISSLMICVIPFIPGDLFKCILAIILRKKLKNIL